MTQSMGQTPPGLTRLREAARQDRRLRFTNLLHHLSPELLEQAYYALNRQAKPGVDGEDWARFGEDLPARLADLHARIQSNRYKPQPVKRVHIPKPDGQQRALGVTTVEDKVVQQALVWVLESIYEVDFVGFSYGFRPGRDQHQALDAVYMAITTRRVNWVLDADIAGFFDSIDHDWLMRLLEVRIADRRILRLIERMLKAGVMENGRRSKQQVGTPQGAVISPLLGNIYLHYALDRWVQQWRQRHARGEVYVVRYADDAVAGCQYQADAEQLHRELDARLRRFALGLHDDKTRLIEFGRFARSNRRRRGQGKPATFDFLGFTHICSQRRRDGGFKLKRISMAKRLRAKLHQIKHVLYRYRHSDPHVVGRWLHRVVQGFFNYHAIPDNHQALQTFRTAVNRYWFRALRRRSQKTADLPWHRFQRLVRRYIPTVRVLHPYPNQRLRV